MSDWCETTIGAIAQVLSGSGFPKKYQGKADGKYPFFKVSDMNLVGNERFMLSANNHVSENVRAELRAKVFPTGSIIFPKIGAAIATNKKRIVTRPSCVDNNVAGLVPNIDIVDPEFLYYWMYQHNLSEFANKSELPSIRKSTVQAYPLVIPGGLPEQKRIVAILDEAFEAIDAATANAEKNLANARELFLTAVNQKLSESGPCWITKPLAELGDIQTGATPKTSDSSNYGDFIPFVKPADFETDGTISYRTDGLSKKGLSSARLVGGGSVLMVCIGATIGKVGVADKPLTTNQQINSLTPSGSYSPRLLYYVMTTRDFQTRVRSNAGQATLPIISKSKWAKLTVSVPADRSEQDQIAVYLDTIQDGSYRMADAYERKLSLLAELKQSILQKAFTGELTSSAEVEDVLEAAS